MAGTLYTFNVQCSFDVQYTFNESEIESDPDGEEGSVRPTEAALQALEGELYNALHQNHAVDKVMAWADSDSAIGTSLDEE